jgi:hypothetical protein
MKYVLNLEKVMITKISNKTVILDLETEEIYNIRGTAVIILDFIKKPKTIDEVVGKVIPLFEEESIEVIEMKIKTFVKNLLEKDFIKCC